MSITLYKLKGSVVLTNLSASVALFVRVPIAGRIQLVTIGGSLTGDGVTAKVNLVLAKGTVTLYAKENGSGNHDLYIKVDLEIKFIRKISSGEHKLVTLPYVHLFGNFYTSSADLASLDSKWVPISCRI
jgi:hypothetical protein